MSREFTLFQFDVDEDAVRRVLSALPGVTPLSPDEETAADDDVPPVDGEPPRHGGAASDAGPTDAGSEVSDGPSTDRAGAEAHLSGAVGPESDRTGAEKWTAPSTPWPGAPVDEPDEGGLLDRLRDKRTLLIAGGVAVLGVVSAAAVWYLKLRGSDAGQRAGRRSRTRGASDDAAGAGPAADSEREPPADDEESRSYPVDAAPVIGMAFLAVSAVLLRRFTGDADD